MTIRINTIEERIRVTLSTLLFCPRLWSCPRLLIISFIATYRLPLILLARINWGSRLGLTTPLLLLLGRRSLSSEMSGRIPSSIICDHIIIQISDPLIWCIILYSSDLRLLLLLSEFLIERVILLLHIFKFTLINYSLLIFHFLHSWNFLLLVVQSRGSFRFREGLVY